MGATMRIAWQWMRDEIYAGVVAAGYDDVTPAHVGLIRHPTLEGWRPTELARTMQITKQSVNDLLGQLEGLGYLTREPDPADGRGRVVHLTAKGRRLEDTVNLQAGAAERRIAERLGPRRFAQLHDALERLVDTLPEPDGA